VSLCLCLSVSFFFLSPPLLSDSPIRILPTRSLAFRHWIWALDLEHYALWFISKVNQAGAHYRLLLHFHLKSSSSELRNESHSSGSPPLNYPVLLWALSSRITLLVDPLSRSSTGPLFNSLVNNSSSPTSKANSSFTFQMTFLSYLLIIFLLKNITCQEIVWKNWKKFNQCSQMQRKFMIILKLPQNRVHFMIKKEDKTRTEKNKRKKASRIVWEI